MLYAARHHLHTRDELWRIQIAERGLGSAERRVSKKWIGINHGYLADKLIERLLLKGWTILDERWQATPNGNAMHGVVDIGTIEEYKILDVDYTLSLGIHHDNDSRVGIGFYIGCSIRPVRHGLVLGGLHVVRRHSLGLDLNKVIDDGIDGFKLFSSRINDMIRYLQRTPILTERAASMLLTLGLQRTIPASDVVPIWAEYLHPAYEPHNEPTMWNLYNAVSKQCQNYSFMQQLKVFNDVRIAFCRKDFITNEEE